ncbi:MAG: hypothetical protein JWO02_1437 [Solirubrobacterales bacterium]|nr:hypothetical protein [Solirubrobacterales bacterium]
MSRFRVPLLLTAFVIAVPTSASAATKVVDAGVPLASHRAFWGQYGSDVNAFFPSQITIRVGDAIRFRPSGFHTVHLLSRRGGRSSARSLLPSAERVSGALDAAGQPFWFNGQPHFDNAPALLKSNFGKRFTFTGAKELLSGFHTKGSRKAMVVRFTRRGTFTFVCDYHPGMKGSVKVVPRSRRVPTAKRDAADVRKVLQLYLKAAAPLRQAAPPERVINVGNAGAGGLELYDFVPKVVPVPVGATVRFQISPGSLETHSVAAGPGYPDTQPASYLGSIARAFEAVRADPRAIYPSDPPDTPSVLVPTSHGNGFWSSGVLDRNPATPFPASRDLTFPAAGTYVFSCLIHKYMHTEVAVQ